MQCLLLAYFTENYKTIEEKWSKIIKALSLLLCPPTRDCKQHLGSYGSLLWHKTARSSQEHSLEQYSYRIVQNQMVTLEPKLLATEML